VLALSALLSVDCPPAPLPAHSASVHISLSNGTGTPDAILQAMKAQLNATMLTAGIEVGWDEAGDRSIVVTGHLVVVTLRGSCGTPAPVGIYRAAKSLGSAAVADGRVLPFITVECESIAQLLEPPLAGTRQSQRELLYGRTMAFILAHEIHHVTTGSLTHGRTGLTKAYFNARDLLGPPLQFSRSAIAQLRQHRDQPPISMVHRANKKIGFESFVNIR
jgi:hypothetical protein